MTDTQQTPLKIEAHELGQRRFRFADFMMVAFVTLLILSNLIGAAKLSVVHGCVFGAGILFFPVD